MIGRDQLARMKPDASLINVGRGPLIDEAALIEVLRQKKIGGAPWMSSIKSHCLPILRYGIWRIS